MQRVRIGLTVLGGVFVVMLLAAIFSHPSDERPITANSIEQQMLGNGPAPEAPPSTEPKEPLAELGVAPGAAADANDSGVAAH